MRVLIVVTHLLGTGHLSRALTLGRAFADAGHDAHVLSGGMAVPNLPAHGVTLHQLHPVKSDGVNFTTLLDETGQPVDAPYLAARKEFAAQVLAKGAFDVLITELYPFGRRVLKGEFLALLNGARDLVKQPVVLASVRDILAPPSKPQKALETEAVIAAYYDGVLVHSDADVTPLDASWPVSAALGEKLFYTGYVAPVVAGAHPDGAGQGEVIVAAGGGDVGMPLFKNAIKAATFDGDRIWRLLVGGAGKGARIAELEAEIASDNVRIESTRPDFRQMLTGADAAVCMCGYNTAMDLLQSGTRAVFVPFDAGGEVEQTLRAKSLALNNGYEMVPSGEATPTRLFEALCDVRKYAPEALQGAQFMGAKNAVDIAEKMVRTKTV